MPIPRIAYGSGIGAVAGATGGAVSGDRDQSLTQRAGRGILGGMAGAGLGAGAHTALRYRGLTQRGYEKGLGAFEEAALGTTSRKSMDNAKKAIEQNTKKDAARKAADMKKATDEFGFGADNMDDLTKAHRAAALKLHPDRLGDTPEAQANFSRMQAAYEAAKQRIEAAAKATASTEKQSSAFEQMKVASFFYELGTTTSDPYIFDVSLLGLLELS